MSRSARRSSPSSRRSSASRPRSSTCPTGSTTTSAEGSASGARQLRDAWFETLERFKVQHPDLADQLYRMQHRQLPEGWDEDLPTFPADAKGMASRASSSKVLNAIAPHVPWLIGGSADLTPSTKTRIEAKDAGDFLDSHDEGRNLHFGVREHAMAAILNGLALIKVRPYGSGFLIFSDYARAAIRLSALMEIPVIHIFTHDSIGVGEDGPTHQPVEHLASLRAIPGLITLRPADANEVVEAWRVIMKLHHEPVVLVLTRQDVPTLDRTKYAPASGLARGAYVLADAEDGTPDVLLLATGSEVYLCVNAFEKLEARGDQGPRREHALVGAVRAPGPGVPRQRHPAPRHGAGLGGAGLDLRLGAIHRPDRRPDRDAHLRRLGAAEEAAVEVRVHPRQDRRRGHGSDRPGEGQRRAGGRADPLIAATP